MCRVLHNRRLGPPRSVVHSRSTMDDDPVDTKPTIEEACKPGCSQRWADYEACIKRVAASGDEEAHCTGQYLDFWKCVDACAAKKIFAPLK